MARSYRPWSPSEEQALRDACAAGIGGAEIARTLFPSRTTKSVEQKIRANRLGIFALAREGRLAAPPAPPRHDPLPPAPPAIDRGATESPYLDSIPEWLDALRPVQLPAPEPSTAQLTPGAFTIVASDLHFPQHCEQSIAILLETIRQLRPTRLVLNGDTVDLLAVSRYPKDQRHTWSLREEVTAFHAFLHQAMSIGNAWGMTILETEANHSGNGTASRWHRYLSDRVPHLYNHPEAQRLLSYETWFYPSWCPIALVDSLVIADDLLVIHGDLVRKFGAYSARGHMEKWQSSVMHGHTHRIGQSMQRIPAVGSRPNALRRAFETGCLCRLDPSYVTAPDWANGFAIVAHDADETDYGVELVTIQRGQAVVTALGQTVRAAA